MNCQKGRYIINHVSIKVISDIHLFSAMALLNCAHYQMIDGTDVVSPSCICFYQTRHRSKLFRLPHLISEKDLKRNKIMIVVHHLYHDSIKMITIVICQIRLVPATHCPNQILAG